MKRYILQTTNMTVLVPETVNYTGKHSKTAIRPTYVAEKPTFKRFLHSTAFQEYALYLGAGIIIGLCLVHAFLVR